MLVDQSPVGTTPRSNPATYMKAFDGIRKLFAGAELARLRGYTPSTFSFNVEGGRCETCHGEGYEKVEMQFLSDVYTSCPECHGSRFREEVLEVSLPRQKHSPGARPHRHRRLGVFQRQQRRSKTVSNRCAPSGWNMCAWASR